jgi:hypothetical protein
MARRRSGTDTGTDAGTVTGTGTRTVAGTGTGDTATELLPPVPEEGGAVALAPHPEDVLAEPPDARDVSAELAAPPRRRLPWLTLLLSAGVVAVAAFTGGVLVEKHHKDSASPLSALSGARAGSSAGGGRTGGGFGFGGGATAGSGTGTGAGAAGGLTLGTVKLVDGDTIYVTDAQGDTVKVTTNGSTKVTETEDGKVSDLKPGQTVTVRGTRSASGDVAATTVTQGGGFPGFGGAGAGGGSAPGPGAGN